MNKRAKKRLKESIQKDIQQITKTTQEQKPPSTPKGQQERPGFISKPAKKRG